MDEYTSLAGASTVTPPHGRVAELTEKRRIGDRKKHKRNGKEKREKQEESVVVHKRLKTSFEEGNAKARPVVKERDQDEEDTVTQYGKRLHKKKGKNKIDLVI